jgi:hypothetical protein
MQRRLRPLPIALSAGIVAVIAAALPFYASGALAPNTQLQYTKTTKVNMPGILSMFMGKNTGTSETTTISATRERIDSGNTSRIVQCDLKRVITLDNNAKTYYVMTFDQMKAAMAAAEAQMRAQMQAHGYPTPPPATSGPPIQGSGGITLSVNTVNDPNTQQILGMTAHHVTETITGTANGTGQCPNGSMSMTNDEWYVPTPATFSCPLPRPQIPTMMPPPNMPHGGAAANPCMGSFQVQASGKAHTEDRFALKQDTTIDMGVKLTTHEEITKFQISPYDASWFDVPAGYSQSQPPANPYSSH